jgi:hypothetical protein
MGNDCVEVKKKYEFDNINTMYCSAFGMMKRYWNSKRLGQNLIHSNK